MMRSMFSGISGLRAHQAKMDVIGNNISNVNTVGFKASRVTFQEVLNQTIQPAFGSTTGGNNSTIGGMNARQIGLGVAVGSIDVLNTQAGVQRTERPLDVAINGEGYFVIQHGSSTCYSKAGNFYVDNSGNLVTENGDFVCDSTSTADAPNPIKLTAGTAYSNVAINADGTITATKSDGTIDTAVTQIVGIASFPNAQGLVKDGNNLYSASNNSGTVVIAAPDSANKLMPGYLEMSNVDLSQEFTDMIIAQRGFQANSKVITTSSDMLQELTQIIR